MSRFRLLAVASIISCYCSAGFGGLVVEESFISATATGTGVSTTGSTGLDAGEWTFASLARAGVGFSVQTGLTFSDLVTSGGAVQVSDPTTNTTGFNGPLLHRGIDVNVNSQTLWGSYLFSRPSGAPPADSTIAEINTANTATAGFTNARFRTLAEANGAAPQVGMSLSGGGETLTNYPTNYFTDLSLYSDPLLIVSKVTDVGGTTGVTTLAKAWALSKTGFDSIKAGGITEAELNSAAIATATDTTTPATAPNHRFTNADFLRITTLRNNNWGVFDEIRYGIGDTPDLAGILPVAIPEPSAVVQLSAVSVLASCLAGVVYRRMRTAVST